MHQLILRITKLFIFILIGSIQKAKLHFFLIETKGRQTVVKRHAFLIKKNSITVIKN